MSCIIEDIKNIFKPLKINKREKWWRLGNNRV